MTEDLPFMDAPDWKLKRELRLSQSAEQAWKERALKAEGVANGVAEHISDLEKTLEAHLVASGVFEAETREELAQSHYYRECRDYWRAQAESLAVLVDRHNREVHQAMSHEQLFAPPKNMLGLGLPREKED